MEKADKKKSFDGNIEEPGTAKGVKPFVVFGSSFVNGVFKI